MDVIAIDKTKQGRVHDRIRRLKKQLKKRDVPVKKSASKRARFGKPKVETTPAPANETGVVYLGHIPHGFFEEQITGYCSQFGRVNQVRVARSRKNGNSRGYAFVEFENVEVAKIFAETFNKYLMFDRLLVCHYIPVEKRHRRMFDVNITADYCYADDNRKMDKKMKFKSGAIREAKRDEKKRRKIEDVKSFFEKRGIEFNFKVKDPNGILTTETPQHSGAVLEIDESDDEIEFNVPPHVKKVFKKSKNAKNLTLRQSNKSQATDKKFIHSIKSDKKIKLIASKKKVSKTEAVS